MYTTLPKLIAGFNPATVLTIGPVSTELFAECHLDHQRNYRALADLQQYPWQDSTERFDLVILVHVLERLPKLTAQHVLARFRDMISRRLIVLIHIPAASDANNHDVWSHPELLAMGLVQVAANEVTHDYVYAFDLDFYKTIPDWLNSRYWAHPDLFNKFYW